MHSIKGPEQSQEKRLRGGRRMWGGGGVKQLQRVIRTVVGAGSNLWLWLSTFSSLVTISLPSFLLSNYLRSLPLVIVL
jgi:hypothetical protein